MTSSFCSMRLKRNQLTAALHIACVFAFADKDNDNCYNNDCRSSSDYKINNMKSMSWLVEFCSQTFLSKLSNLKLNEYV